MKRVSKVKLISSCVKRSLVLGKVNNITVSNLINTGVLLSRKLPKTSVKSSLPDIKIAFNVKAPLIKGCSVERMGRVGWRGKIIDISNDSALVNWRSHQCWLPLLELYPIDSKGNPYTSPLKPDLFESARLARFNLSGKFPDKPDLSDQQMSFHDQFNL